MTKLDGRAVLRTRARHIRAGVTGITCFGLALLSSACGESSDGGGPSATTSDHTPLLFQDEYFYQTDNDAGIRGRISEDVDDSGRWSEEPEIDLDVDAAGQTLCVNGETGRGDDSLAGSSGAEVGFYLNQPLDDEADEYDASSHGVVGLSFVVDAIPSGGLSFQVWDSAAVWRCLRIDRAGRHDVLFEDLEQCSEREDPLQLDRLTSVDWQFHWPGGDPLPVSMCISELAAIVR